MPTVDEFNRMSDQNFREELMEAFPDARWVLEACAYKRPFESLDDMHTAMCDAIKEGSFEQQFALIASQPDFQQRLEECGSLFDDLMQHEKELLRQMHKNYSGTLGFPFILCLTGLNKQQLTDSLQQRLMNDRDSELHHALVELFKIYKQQLNSAVQA